MPWALAADVVEGEAPPEDWLNLHRFPLIRRLELMLLAADTG